MGSHLFACDIVAREQNFYGELEKYLHVDSSTVLSVPSNSLFSSVSRGSSCFMFVGNYLIKEKKVRGRVF